MHRRPRAGLAASLRRASLIYLGLGLASGCGGVAAGDICEAHCECYDFAEDDCQEECIEAADDLGDRADAAGCPEALEEYAACLEEKAVCTGAEGGDILDTRPCSDLADTLEGCTELERGDGRPW